MKPEEKIVERILKGLEEDHQWDSGRRGFYQLGNPVSGGRYHGINTFLLTFAMMEKGYSDPRWCTYRQAAKIGTHVKKGEKSEEVIFWKMRQYKEKDSDETRNIPMLRFYNVFNFEQLEEIPEKYKAPEALFEIPQEPQALVDSFLDRESIDLVQCHGSPHYAPLRDTIGMPPPEEFTRVERYYESFFHECIHATGHTSRLSRPLEGAWNKDAYSREELIAEFGCAFLLGRTKMDSDLGNLSAYIKSWHKAIRENPKDLIIAAGQGERAMEYFLDSEHKEHKDEESSTDTRTGSAVEAGAA